ncbi:WecB/TagA/CpsF family glycosyltransferase [Arthrobacter sp. NQ4]|uniref:WecB/TagA/CpsF family glycosyltransferase n=1 Tax=Arthrobacter sp. NQ4 TaxID=3027930 RepID=UPI0023B1A7FD|nr:WecB/TagA/CpsF family glycosyltransferase [Arthrobacter sp. NQ4]MDE8588530.1 WecB/TagA/CpsF family glycosyltransferase [Arthrobacter sp. NQ4]
MSSAPALFSSFVRKTAAATHAEPRRVKTTPPVELPFRRLDAPEVIALGGALVHLTSFDQALDIILRNAAGAAGRPLAVASANLDHVRHFGQGASGADALMSGAGLRWLTLLDGSPLVSQAERLTHKKWPRLAGSDLSWPILEAAAANSLTVGFLGGRSSTHQLVRERLGRELPNLRVAGYWAPDRQVLGDAAASRDLASDIAGAGVQILFVCLGKPRQELWISAYGHLTGARVLLGFGAAVDFLAGTMRRAPLPVRNAGLEWAWRLVLEPKRLASRYLVQGPAAYARLRLASGFPSTSVPLDWRPKMEMEPGAVQLSGPGSFADPGEPAEVAVLIVTYNSEDRLPFLVEDLRREVGDQSIKVVVADNSPTTATIDALADQPDVHIFATGGNLGYAAGINLAMQRAGAADAFLVLNPDMRLEPGCVAALRLRMRASNAGVVVPLLRDDDGSLYPSLRREPTVSRAMGDAVLGSRLPLRPGWLSEMDFDPSSYVRPHQVDWATGAALLIDSLVARRVGDWDERYFLYSEETDFLRRVRRAGASVWFEPAAQVIHSRGGSGSSPALDALMAANRVRYIRKFRPATYARIFHGAVILSALLRSPLPGHRGILGTIVRESRWAALPGPDCVMDPALMPTGSVIIPAHNEAAVLSRTLQPLVPYAAAGRLEVIVACNGCSDETASIAAQHPGVRVLQISEASKVAALNAADRAASLWPRLYLDADIEIQPAALASVFSALSARTSAPGGAPYAARPEFVYDSHGAHWLVRAYYRARFRMASQRSHLWGAGAYAVSAQGHQRIQAFPRLTADDLYVDRLFSDDEKAIITTTPLVVRTPRSVKGLHAILRRTYRGNAEQGGITGAPVSRKAMELLSTVTGPISAFDAAVYALVVLRSRSAARLACPTTWERDESSRQPPSSPPENQESGNL